MEPKFNTIKTKSDAPSDYSVLASWHAAIQGEADAVHIGVLGAGADVEMLFREFLEKKEYESAFCDFVLMTESGEILASYLRDRWEIHTKDIRQAFSKLPTDMGSNRNVASSFLQQKFDELDTEFSRSEVRLIIEAVSGKFAELIARNPTALKELEWRDLERILAEVFHGIGFKVELTPPSKDGGKDIILECRISGKRHTYIVEVKHWRSDSKVGNAAIKDFLDVIVKEQRDAGLFLSTYGYTSNAFEAITEVERHRLRFGDKEKVISLCKTYTDTKSGIVVSGELLPKVLFEHTK